MTNALETDKLASPTLAKLDTGPGGAHRRLLFQPDAEINSFRVRWSEA